MKRSPGCGQPRRGSHFRAEEPGNPDQPSDLSREVTDRADRHGPGGGQGSPQGTEGWAWPCPSTSQLLAARPRGHGGPALDATSVTSSAPGETVPAPHGRRSGPALR